METQRSCIPEKNRQKNNLLKRVILRSSSKVANQKRYHGTSAEHCKIHMHAFLSHKHELNHYLSLHAHAKLCTTSKHPPLNFFLWTLTNGVVSLYFEVNIQHKSFVSKCNTGNRISRI